MIPNDASLVKRVLAGEKAAFGPLIDRHWSMAMRCALRQLGNLADAEDVVQDAFFQAFLHLQSLKTPERFGAWLNGIVVNLCRMWHRSKRNDVVFEDGERRIIGQDRMAGMVGTGESQASRLRSPEAVYETRESYQALLAALAILPAEQRQAIQLHYLNGLSLREISARAQVTVGAVKVRLHRARTKLRAALAGGEHRRRVAEEPYLLNVPAQEMMEVMMSTGTGGKHMPLFPTRDIVVFPHMKIPLFLGRPKSIKALEAAVASDGRIFLAAQRDAEVSEPTGEDMYSVGTVAQVLERLYRSDGSVKVIVEGKQRGRILRHGDQEEFFSVEVEELAEQCERTDAVETLMREVKDRFGSFRMLYGKEVSPQAVGIVETIDDPIPLGDGVSAYLKLDVEAKQQLLETLDPAARLKKILEHLPSDLQMKEIQRIALGGADIVEKHQRQLLEQTQYIYSQTPISDATAKAYLTMPRHLFVKRYREWGTKEWHEVHFANFAQHAATLYSDKPLILFGEDDDNILSTISQPSFVLRMLDILQLKPGHTVFELGAGSGWNAALLGHLVGPAGHVYSLEIIPEVAWRAAESIEASRATNVHVIAADGGEGHTAGAPYDRAIFTAGAYDLPRHFYDQIKVGGLLLIVIKNEGGGDNLFLLRKMDDHFESLESMSCGFVQLRGKHQIDSLDPISLETLSEWGELQDREVVRTPFWWGGKGNEGSMWRTLGIRSFLGITEPSFQAFKTDKTDQHSREDHYFGLWDKENGSLVLAKDESLIAYGNVRAKERLLQSIHQWVDLGMPAAASFMLQVYPHDFPLTAGEHQWIVKRKESQFLWSLER